MAKANFREVWARLKSEAALYGKMDLIGYPYPIEGLNKITRGGRMPYALTSIGAPPGTGKSMLACQMVWTIANADYKCTLISTEMGADQVVNRIIAFAVGVSCDDVERGKLNAEQAALAEAAIDILDKRVTLIDDVFDAQETADLIKSEAVNKTSDCMLVDFIQDLEFPTAVGIFERTSAIVKLLRNAAKKNKLPLIVFSQLSAEDTDRVGGGWRGGKDLYIKSDLGMLLVTDEESDDENDLVMIIKKHRHGRRGRFLLKYNQHHTGLLPRQWVPKPAEPEKPKKISASAEAIKKAAEEIKKTGDKMADLSKDVVIASGHATRRMPYGKK